MLLIGGEAVPFALARIPKAGETRGNLAAGGRGVARPLTARDREIAAALAPRCGREGLLVVGLDVIGDYLTEVNVTSPTCFVEITSRPGSTSPAMFADALEKRCRMHVHQRSRAARLREAGPSRPPIVHGALLARRMIGILIIAHGTLGESLVRCAHARARQAAAAVRGARGGGDQTIRCLLLPQARALVSELDTATAC